MALEIQSYREEQAAAVQAFNSRLRARGVTYRFPEAATPTTLAPAPGRSIYWEYFLASEGDVVRGGYAFKHQEMAVDGAVVPIGNYQFPLSEGLIDKHYTSLGVRFLRHAMRMQPLLYSLGLGGQDVDAARLLRAGGWRMADVPFYFRVFRARPFLRNIRPLRKTPVRRLLLDTLALTGLGALALRLDERLLSPARVDAGGTIAERVDSFAGWADDLWRRSLPHVRMMTARDGATLDALYPPGDPRFIRLRVRDGDIPVGWAVLLDTRMTDNPYFGAMRVGTLVDCLALPAAAPAVMLAATNHLRDAGADIAVTNQSHALFCGALQQCGFRAGPSNFVLALSPALAQRIGPLEHHRDEIHVTRGDGDGPYNL